jgi:hypothetical protein
MMTEAAGGLAISSDASEDLDRLCARIEQAMGDHLVSISLYGSAVAGGHDARVSNINLLIVLDAVTAGLLRELAPVLRAARGLRPAVQVLAEGGVAAAAEVFPMELDDMRRHHRVLRGRDVLDGIAVDRTALLRQCQRELEGLAIRMRGRLLRGGGAGDTLQQMVDRSLPTVIAGLRHVLRAQGEEVPADKGEVVRRAAARHGFDPQPFLDALAVRSREQRPRGRSLEALFDAYFDAVQALGRLTDRLCVPQA